MPTFSVIHLQKILEQLQESPLALKVGIPKIQGPTCHLDPDTWNLLVRASPQRGYSQTLIQGFQMLKDKVTTENLGLTFLELRRLRTRKGKHVIRPCLYQDQAAELKRIAETAGLSPSQTLEAFAFLYVRSLDSDG